MCLRRAPAGADDRSRGHSPLPRARGLARQKFPEYLVTVDELPRVSSGKVSKDVLRARAKAIAEALDGTR
jgi:acyl-CoA synthetase (AMP-forming)/AMP-acid ligase II